MRVLLTLLLVASSLSAQDAVDDPDFTFSFTMPLGLERLGDDRVAAMQQKTPEEVANIPRSASESGEIAHRYLFGDVEGRGREGSLLLADGPPPFGDPDQFVQAIEQEMGMTVDVKEPLRPPTYMPGVRLEGVRTNPKGVEMRATVVYYILSPDPMRWGLLRLQAPSADWEIAGPEFLQAIASVKFPLPEGATAGGGGQQGARPQRGRPASQPKESWSTLQVTGSLVLAAALLLSLFFAGRGSP